MSAQALTGPAAAIGSGVLAAEQRVAQLQSLIEAARQTAASGLTPTAAASTSAQPAETGFAGALAAATSTPAEGVAYRSAIPGAGTAAPQGSEGSSSQYDALIEAAAIRNGLEPAVLHGLIQQESGFNPGATSSAGAMGLTQLMPGTASSMGVADPLNPAESIEGGARYLGQLMTRFGGNTADALAAYNAGPGAVEQYGGIPPYAETQSYVSTVLGNAEAYRQSHAATMPTGAPA